MAKTEFDELMKRYVTNQVTEAERVRIEAWLETINDRNATDLDLTPQEQDDLYNRIISKQSNLDSIRSFRPESLRIKNRNKWTMRIAAGIAICLAISYAVIKVTASQSGPELQRLADGSLVWLRANSNLTYTEVNGSRFVKLEGEALFEVAKDAQHPFIVEADGVTIRVVGTSFNVRTGDRLEVKVLTGTVRVLAVNDSAGVTLTRNQQTVYDHQSGFSNAPLSVEDAHRITEHTQYVMKFTNEKFKSVLDRLQQKFGVEFQNTDATALDCHVNLDLTDNSLVESMQKITAILNLEYTITGSTVMLTGPGCK